MIEKCNITCNLRQFFLPLIAAIIAAVKIELDFSWLCKAYLTGTYVGVLQNAVWIALFEFFLFLAKHMVWDQYYGCCWFGAYLAPGHLQPCHDVINLVYIMDCLMFV